MTAELLTPATFAGHPLPPVEGGDKDSHGAVLIVAGSREIPGEVPKLVAS
ncbi:MAG: hypothetical protein H0W65_01650 [Sphingomonas sp.]|nr:hypothetical protein [Sphingomonas sp.]MBA3666413.1 hypothetical protein [Sphingomonas sp.]